MIGKRRDTERRGDLQGPELGQHLGLLQLLANSLRKQLCAAHIGLFAEHAKLFSAKAGDDVGLSLDAPKHLTELLEDPVARSVTVGVVDRFEVVEIRHNQRQFAAESLRGHQLLLHLVEERPLIEATRQAVRRRQLLEQTNGSRVRHRDGELVRERLQRLAR